MVEFAKLAFEFDYEGIILKTPEGDLTLPRKNLLRHYETFIKRYKHRPDANKYALKLEE